MNKDQVRSLTPHLPTYSQVRHFIAIVDGTQYSLYSETFNTIWEQRGNPQENVDWSDPDDWIPERLSGKAAEFASRVWRGSKGEVNPRHMRGMWWVARTHKLLERDDADILRLSNRGKTFIDTRQVDLAAEIDSYEGMLTLLQIIADRSPGKRGDFLPPFRDFCLALTRYKSDNSIKAGLRNRLLNLVERNLILRSGMSYEITEEGLNYLSKYTHLLPGLSSPDRSKQAELRRIARALRTEGRNQLLDFLVEMNPFKFEELVQFLLEEMGYTDVTTTSPTNDKGVDVVGNIELGISSVREVVQVKRRKSGNIGRKVLDQLRGSLHRFEATRGTIITTTGFSAGTKKAAFESGAAPITLIDGQKLIDLLIEHEIGIKIQTVEYFEFDQTKLAQFGTDEDELLAT